MGFSEVMAPVSAQPSPPAEQPVLLIVDDEAGPRESLRIVFKDRYRCAVATCGRDGIEYARSHPVDLAILDIKMPDLSGVDVLREIKRIDPNTECIMLTGYETIETARAAVRYGAADYLNKPFDVFAMRELLDKCLGRRRQRVAAEASLRSLQRVNEELSHELAQSNRAVAAGLLSAGVVHEMNNPLSIIAGYAHLLERDLAELGMAEEEGNQQIQQRLANIQHEIERCKGIARRFLNFSRTNQRSAENIDAARLIEDTAALVKAHPANRAAEISVSSSPGELWIYVHPAEIIQILINLAVNSLQAMEGQGRLGLRAEPAPAAPRHAAYRSPHFDPTGHFVKLVVSDNGSGIAPENLKKVFDPYYTTRPQGTGLGLAIVTELVAKYGGAVDVESVLHQGTTFSVYLPHPR